MGGLQAKSMTSQRAEPSKMAGMHYHGNVMTTTRWRLYVTMETLWQQQDGGYALLWYIVTAKVDWACYRCILHLQQYSHRLNFLFLCKRRRMHEALLFYLLSLSTFLRPSAVTHSLVFSHLVISLPLFLVPWRFQSSSCGSVASCVLCSVWTIEHHFISFISCLTFWSRNFTFKF